MDHVFELRAVDIVKVVRRDNFDIRHEKRGIRRAFAIRRSTLPLVTPILCRMSRCAATVGWSDLLRST